MTSDLHCAGPRVASQENCQGHWTGRDRKVRSALVLNLRTAAIAKDDGPYSIKQLV